MILAILSSTLLFLLILSVLVLIHEFGHFIVARFFGVKVEEFGLGFPPKAKKLGVWGGTEYTLNWLPLGGFVRLKGEQGGELDPDTLACKPIWQRILILVAGVAMNVVLTAAILTVGFAVGMPSAVDGLRDGAVVRDEKVMITHIETGSPAQEGGLKLGDAIVAINGEVMETTDAVREYTRSHLGETIAMTVVRGGETLTQEVGVAELASTGAPGIGIGLMHAGTVSYPLHLAVVEGVRGTYAIGEGIVVSLYTAITRGAFDSFVGPVGIAAYSSEAAQLGFVHILMLMAQLSMSLAIFNVLPIPALDGGRILFACIEKVRGRALKASLENALHLAGFGLLILMIIAITYRDVARLWPF